MDQEQKHPLRLRDEWHKAYCGFEAESEMPADLDEVRAHDLLRSLSRYIERLENNDHKALRTLKDYALKNEKVFATFSHFSHGTLIHLPFYVSQYIQEAENLSKKAMKRSGLVPTESVGEAKSFENGLNYIAQSPTLSFMGFFKYWFDLIKPQYSQPAFLHTEGTLLDIQNQHPAVEKEASILLESFRTTGVADNLKDICRSVTRETAQEKTDRLEKMAQLLNKYSCRSL